MYYFYHPTTTVNAITTTIATDINTDISTDINIDTITDTTLPYTSLQVTSLHYTAVQLHYYCSWIIAHSQIHIISYYY